MRWGANIDPDRSSLRRFLPGQFSRERTQRREAATKDFRGQKPEIRGLILAPSEPLCGKSGWE
jgi:hypothetical protein